MTKGIPKTKAALFSSALLLLAFLFACGTAAEETAPAEPAAPAAPAAAPAAASGEPAAAAATPVAKMEEAPAPAAEPAMGKDKAIAVIATEPEVLFYMITADAHTGQFTDTINAYIGHLDKDTLEVAATSLVESWTQTAVNEWEYKLRDGVTFHDG